MFDKCCHRSLFVLFCAKNTLDNQLFHLSTYYNGNQIKMICSSWLWICYQITVLHFVPLTSHFTNHFQGTTPPPSPEYNRCFTLLSLYFPTLYTDCLCKCPLIRRIIQVCCWILNYRFGMMICFIFYINTLRHREKSTWMIELIETRMNIV